MWKSFIIYIFLFSFSQGMSFSQEKNEAEVSLELDTLKAINFFHHLPEVQNNSNQDTVVDLSGDEFYSLPEKSGSHILSRAWYNNITLSGFGGVGFLDSGKEGTRAHGGFLIKEASLFVEGDVWFNTTFFIEIQTNRLDADSTLFIQTGEVHAHFRNVLGKWGDDLLGIKVGRVDIPFGEEYLWKDARDNPLISNSASYPYGWDEGVLLYGKMFGMGWISSITDGTHKRSVEDHPSKAINAKVYGNIFQRLYLSSSYMVNGKTTESEIEFGGSHIRPVGSQDTSSVGSSSSKKIGSTLFEVDAKYSFGEWDQSGYIAFTYGKAQLKDRDQSFERDWGWFSVEPFFRVSEKIYFAARYSEIGTYNSREGYHFDGKTTAGGNKAFGYDTKRFRRLTLGVGWKPNLRTILKLEMGWDWFDLIESSPFNPKNSERNLFGFELVVIF